LASYHHYTEGSAFSFGLLARNLSEKLTKVDFLHDLDQLVIQPPGGYEVVAAADLVMRRLGSRLSGAPDDVRDTRKMR